MEQVSKRANARRSLIVTIVFMWGLGALFIAMGLFMARDDHFGWFFVAMGVMFLPMGLQAALRFRQLSRMDSDS